MTIHTINLGTNMKAKMQSVTYQTQTVKPVFRSDSIVSLTELIAAGHCVAVPHVAGEGGEPGQALCGIQYAKNHGSLTKRDEATRNTIEPD
jgi:hypothetical protein